MSEPDNLLKGLNLTLRWQHSRKSLLFDPRKHPVFALTVLLATVFMVTVTLTFIQMEGSNMHAIAGWPFTWIGVEKFHRPDGF
ncbi:MAG TPA: hypothetical protein VGB30_06505 [bacterium]|jgi:hypothetical protein